MLLRLCELNMDDKNGVAMTLLAYDSFDIATYIIMCICVYMYAYMYVLSRYGKCMSTYILYN